MSACWKSLTVSGRTMAEADELDRDIRGRLAAYFVGSNARF